ncbi:MAG: hypothetical protein FWG91_03340 [Lachnospiraceae bacterium]|nr:hypothetical protein [Lachnospiraceae bacterium]
MKFSENINENLDKLLNSKKTIILIPGIIVTVIAAVLLVMSLIGLKPENTNHEQALTETKETIMSELVKAKEYLSQLETAINDNWKVLRQDNFPPAQNDDSLTALTNNIYEELSDVQITNHIFAGKITQLADDLALLKAQIEIAKGEIADLLKILESASQSQQIEAAQSFNNLYQAVSEIQNQYSEAFKETKVLYQEIKESASENYEELMEMLGQVIERMEIGSNESLAVLLDSIAKLNLLNHEINEVMNIIQANHEAMAIMSNKNHEAIELMNLTTKEKLEQMNLNQETLKQMNITNQETLEQMNINNQETLELFNLTNQESFTRLDVTINEYLNGLNLDLSSGTMDLLKQMMDLEAMSKQRFDHIDQTLNPLYLKLNDVFQFVSDGKRLLAAALLTKGQTVAETATFAELEAAVKAIETTIMLENKPGLIEYIYHFHTIAGNGDTASENENSLNALEREAGSAEGCFFAPAYHVHRDDNGISREADYQAQNSGGCFTEQKFSGFTHHVHSGCPQTAHRCGCTSGSRYTELGGAWAGCTGCRHAWHEPPWPCQETVGHSWTCGNQPNNAGGFNFFGLSCAKTSEDIDAYGLGCGYVYGQIAGALITY